MTSSCSSDDIDQEEIQLALQAAKIATREKIRSRFHGSNDLIHRLFVCISGMRVAFVVFLCKRISECFLPKDKEDVYQTAGSIKARM